MGGGRGARRVGFALEAGDAGRAAFGGVDIWGVVNGAGVGGGSANPQDTDIAIFDKVMSINARGSLLVTKYAAREMIRGGRGGAIVNVPSQAGLVALTGHISSGSSKPAPDNTPPSPPPEPARHGPRVTRANPPPPSPPIARWHRAPNP